LPYLEECSKDKRGAIAVMLPPVTLELHETTYVPSGPTEYMLSGIFYAANNEPLPSEETWHYGGRWALLPPYSDWEVRVTPVLCMPTVIDATC
jgi:hypothetical protein